MLQTVAYKVDEQVAALLPQLIHAPFYKVFPELQVRATFVALQVAASKGQTMHAPLIKEYPVLHTVGVR